MGRSLPCEWVKSKPRQARRVQTAPAPAHRSPPFSLPWNAGCRSSTKAPGVSSSSAAQGDQARPVPPPTPTYGEGYGPQPRAALGRSIRLGPDRPCPLPGVSQAPLSPEALGLHCPCPPAPTCPCLPAPVHLSLSTCPCPPAPTCPYLPLSTCTSPPAPALPSCSKSLPESAQWEPPTLISDHPQYLIRFLLPRPGCLLILPRILPNGF